MTFPSQTKKIIVLRPKRSTVELDKAIVAARKAIGPFQKSQIGQRGNKTADINDVIDEIEEHIGAFDLKISCKHVIRNGIDYYRTEIKHAPSGQYDYEERLFIPDEKMPNKNQAYGAGETYARRYSIVGLLNLRGGEPDIDKRDALEAVKNAAKDAARNAALLKTSNPNITDWESDVPCLGDDDEKFKLILSMINKCKFPQKTLDYINEYHGVTGLGQIELSKFGSVKTFLEKSLEKNKTE